MIVRNIVLGLVGAAIGSIGFIWLGYAAYPGRAPNPGETPPAMNVPTGPGPSTSFTGMNTGIVSTGNNNTINVVHSDPRRWGFNTQQAENFKRSLTSAGGQGTVIIRLNDNLSRTMRDQLVTLIQSVPGWNVVNQGDFTTGTLGDIHGLSIYTRDPSNPSFQARALMNALGAADISPTRIVQQWPNEDFRIAVGAPP